MDPFYGFWEKLKRPIIALAPMDGVTDFACRAIMARHGRPDILFTEFTTATGLFYAPERILRDFEYQEIERPIVAQIYGNNPDDFYRATVVVCELGFDGIDINMGCPSKQVMQHNCGGMLITQPQLALEIIRATRSAINDWSRGQRLEDLFVSEKIVEMVGKMVAKRQARAPMMRRTIPYSVKTRIGYDSVVIEKWVKTLLSEKPAAISIHGRTLKQMYRGAASWEAIGRAVQVAKGSGTLILGNGDILSRADALKKIDLSGVDGVLVGRASLGNPWIFHPEPTTVSLEGRIAMALEHARLYFEERGDHGFSSIKKHLAGYLRNIPEASSWRRSAMEARNFAELEKRLSYEGNS